MVVETIELDDLDKKSTEAFQGLVVRKDLLRRLRSAFTVPTFVIEFLLGKYCASPDPAVIENGMEFVRRQVPDGHIFTQPWPAGPSDKRRDQVFYYQYKHDRARRTLRGIDEQVAKAEKAVAGQAPVKRNRFIQLSGGTKSVNRALEAKARALAGIKGYVTNIPDPTPELVIDAYHRLFQIEKSFRMSKSDLAARPIYHRIRDSIEAHLTIVFAALAVSRWIEQATGWSIKKFVKTLRRYRTIEIHAGGHTITAADPLPDNVHTVIEEIKARAAAH
jgi:BREX system Lon protease-like protein BrxL N-terminal